MPPQRSHSRQVPSSDREVRQRWAAVVRREPKADFFYAVRTTGIYCRPGCASRLPLKENVTFFTSARAAEAAGFRACLRCRPSALSHSRRDAALLRLCAQLGAEGETRSFSALADDAGLSAASARRLFLKAFQLTPTAYQAALRYRRAQGLFEANASILELAYASGYGALSRFYDQLSGRLGMSPSQYQKKAPGLTISFAVTHCSLGSLLVATTTRGICAVELGDEPEEVVQELRRRFAHATLVRTDSELHQVVLAVTQLVDAQPGTLTEQLTFDTQGTIFQERVWRELRKIPTGQTWTYSELAARLQVPRAVRAVASACGQNPLAVITPCHRVVRADQSLAGYRWGLGRKKLLLEREKRVK